MTTVPLTAPTRSPAAGTRALSMTASSMGLIAGKVASMALGFLFWILAARVAPVGDVGLAAAAASAMTLCVQVGLIGIGAAFIAAYPSEGDRATLLDTAISLAALTGVAAGLAFVVLAAAFFDQLDVVASSPAYAAWFLVAASAGTVGVVLDQISMALGRGDQVLARNALNGIVTLAPLALLAPFTAGVTATQLFSFWSLGAVAAVALAARQLRGSNPGYRFRPRLPRRLARALVRNGLGHYALTCAERLPVLVLPIIITETLVPEVNAYWYSIWMMSWAAYVVPVSVGIGLFAEGSHRPDTVRSATRKAVRSAVGIGGTVALVLAAGAPLALGALGRQYATSGVAPLRIMTVGILPLAVIHAYYAVARVRRRLGEAVVTAAVSGVVGVVAVTAAGRRHGLAAMAVSWVTVQALAAAWCGMRLRWTRERPVDVPQPAGAGT